MEMKDRIQQKANDLFRRYGVKSITMDEIAAQLGVSKKTIYQYFSDKDELVEVIVRATRDLGVLHGVARVGLLERLERLTDDDLLLGATPAHEVDHHRLGRNRSRGARYEHREGENGRQTLA